MRFIWAVASLAVAASAVSWDSANAPTKFSDSYEYKLANLPTNGSIDTPAWSETYWPSYASGIAHRWNALYRPQDFKYQLYTKEELLQFQQAGNMSLIMSLSPAEKYDIFKGRYDYPTVHEEWGRTHASDASWEGICHGWAPAALEYAQPNPVNLTNADGINVAFGSSDVKALLSFYAGQADTSATVKFAGRRCNSDLYSNPSAATRPECLDMDAAAYHIIIANQIGVLKQGFVVDRERGYQVWNQPVNAFTTTLGDLVPARVNATEGANQSVLARTTMTYSTETSPEWKAHEASQTSDYYEYYLDLDADGNIIGGEMQSFDRVDFSWSEKSSPFYGYWAELKDVYANATNDTTHPSIVNMFTLTEDHLHAPTHVNSNSDSGVISFHDYANLEHRSWSIGKLENCEANFEKFVTVIDFSHFETERHRDQLSIFEGAHGTGALVSVLHGSLPTDKVVKVQGPCALLVFKADNHNNNFGGFEAAWKVISAEDN